MNQSSHQQESRQIASEIARDQKNKRRFQTPSAANDNGAAANQDRLVHEALRLFGEYGLAAAQTAHARAKDAFFQGNKEAYHRWLGICQLLDRRMADELRSPLFTQPGRPGDQA